MRPYYDDGEITLYHGRCEDVLPTLEAQSIDAVIADIPYGTTACAWDTPIAFDLMWRELKRLSRPRGAIVLFGSQPFTSALVMSNVDWFRHEWVWRKNKGSNFANTVREPFKEHENIVVFSAGGWTYKPQMQDRNEGGRARVMYQYSPASIPDTQVYRKFDKVRNYVGVLRHPSSVQDFNTQTGLHPTQKPLLLMEYLVKTYTNEGDTVLDFTSGSGTTLRACKNLGRRCIGIEQEERYCAATVARLAPQFETALIDTTTDYGPLFAQELP